MDRRTFLVLGGTLGCGALLVACTEGTRPSPLPSTPGVTDPDRAIRADTVASELALIAAYRAAIEAFPQLEAQLRPLARQHEAHLAAVDPAVSTASASPTASASAAGTPASAPPTASTSPSSPTTPRRALAQLADDESTAQRQRAAACDGAKDAALARTLCLVAASEGQHAAVLVALAAGEAR